MLDTPIFHGWNAMRARLALRGNPRDPLVLAQLGAVIWRTAASACLLRLPDGDERARQASQHLSVLNLEKGRASRETGDGEDEALHRRLATAYRPGTISP
jgi:hypothetical protein